MVLSSGPMLSGNYAGMTDDAKRVYENRLLGFFLLNLPVTTPRER